MHFMLLVLAAAAAGQGGDKCLPCSPKDQYDAQLLTSMMLISTMKRYQHHFITDSIMLILTWISAWCCLLVPVWCWYQGWGVYLVHIFMLKLKLLCQSKNLLTDWSRQTVPAAPPPPSSPSFSISCDASVLSPASPWFGRLCKETNPALFFLLGPSVPPERSFCFRYF